MNMNYKFKISSAVLALLPFAAAMVISAREWRLNAVDRFDPVFLVTGLMTGGILLRKRWMEGVSSDKYGFAVSFAGFVMMTLPFVCNGICGGLALKTAGALLFASGIVCGLFGWRLFWRLLPAFALLALAIPTSCLMDVFPCVTLEWKMYIAAFLCIFALFALLTDFNPPPRREGVFVFSVTVYLLLFSAFPAKHAGTPLMSESLAVDDNGGNSMHPYARLLNDGWKIKNVTPVYIVKFNIPRRAAVLRMEAEKEKRGTRIIYLWASDMKESRGDLAAFREKGKRAFMLEAYPDGGQELAGYLGPDFAEYEAVK